MSSSFSDSLRSGMERFTADIQVPAGLVSAVVRRHRRRRYVALAAVGCAALVATGAGLTAALPGGAGNSAAPATQTVAYLVRHAALAAGRQQHLIEYTRSAEPGKPGLGYEVSWTHGAEYTGAGSYRREDIVHGRVQAEYGTRWANGKLTYTVVNYATRTWERRSLPWDTTRLAPASTDCASGPGFADYRGFIQWGLRCHHFLRMAGTARMNGVSAIKIVNVAPRQDAGFTWDFWVNPKTYLPVRTVLDAEHVFPSVDRIDEQTNYRWLPLTAGNLRQLAITIPAGFRRVASMPLADACGFLPCN